MRSISCVITNEERGCVPLQYFEPGNKRIVKIMRQTKRIPYSNSSSVRITLAEFTDDQSTLFFVDQAHKLFELNLISGCFQLLTTFPFSCTSLRHNRHYQSEIILGLSDHSLRVFDRSSEKFTHNHHDHASSVSTIELGPKCLGFCITTSPDCAILWNLRGFVKYRKLTANSIPSLPQTFIESRLLCVRFLPPSGRFVVSCYRDGTLYIWNTLTFDCLHKFSTPNGQNIFYRTLCYSDDGSHLFAAGQGNVIHSLSISPEEATKSPCLKEVIRLQCDIKAVKKIEWLPYFVRCESSSSIASFVSRCLSISNCSSQKEKGALCVLASDRVIRILTRSVGEEQPAWLCKTVISMSPDCVSNFYVSASPEPHSTHPVAIIDWNGNLQLRDLLDSPMNQRQKTRSEPAIPVVECRSQQSEECSSKSLSTSRNSSVRRTSKCKQLEDLRDTRKLRLILREYRQFPDKYRNQIWTAVLQLPRNKEAFANLQEKSVHLAYELLPKHYPIRDGKLMRVLQKTASCLTHWCSLFGELDYLPLFIFPFVRMFQNNTLEAFEVVATILCNWCGSWFEYFPNPPINVLCMVENVLAANDQELYQHFVKHNVTSEIYAWPILKTAFSDILTQAEWMALWDTLICHHPSMALIATAAYATLSRKQLLCLEDLDTFECFFSRPSAMPIRLFLDKIAEVHANTPKHIHPRQLLANSTKPPAEGDTGSPKQKLHFIPLPKGFYPIISRYPVFIVDFQIKERERIREEEKALHEQKQLVDQVKRKTEYRSAEVANWLRQQELLLQAEEQRRVKIGEEESKLFEQRKRLNALVREVKLRQMDLAETSNLQIKNLDLKQRSIDLTRLDDYLSNLKKKRKEEADLCEELAELTALDGACREQLNKNSVEMTKAGFNRRPNMSQGEQPFGITETSATGENVSTCDPGKEGKIEIDSTMNGIEQKLFDSKYPEMPMFDRDCTTIDGESISSSLA